VFDTVEFEKRGVPSLLICSDAFEAEARELAQRMGLPDIRLAVIRHPVVVQTDEELWDSARQALDAFRRFLIK
jgi:alkanesulfonate monooxygenase SsuD/methylene tetrahydromethanopterin reductase-like flavin-dependent oxidoreductase (luciferase family)